MDLNKLAEGPTVSSGARRVEELSEEEAIKEGLAEGAIESLVDEEDPEGITDLGLASRLSSTEIRSPLRSDSSRKSEMPSSFLSLTIQNIKKRTNI